MIVQLRVLKILRFQRNVLLALSTVLLGTNTMLAFKLVKSEVRTILVPTLDKELMIGTKSVSPDYLQVRAEQIVSLLFNLRSETHEYAISQILRQCDSARVKEFKEQLEILTQDVKQKGYYYTFQTSRYEIDTQNLTVKFKGDLDTYVNDKKIQSLAKAYSLGFVNHGGVLNLISFEEVK
jgi:type IV conjugative transfer system protein TraE